MKNLAIVAPLSISLAACFCLQSCSKPQATSTQSNDKLQGKLVLTGASTIAPLAAEIGKSFEAVHPGVRVDVQSGGSSRGVTDARKGLANIGMVSRALKDDEKDLKAFSIARDGVGITLHKDNPVNNLSDAQVVDIYTGKVNNWKQVGGKDAPITVINKARTLNIRIIYSLL